MLKANSNWPDFKTSKLFQTKLNLYLTHYKTIICNLFFLQNNNNNNNKSRNKLRMRKNHYKRYLVSDK